MECQLNKVILKVTDGHDLVLNQYSPEGDPIANVIIASAMGATQSYYAPIAKWLAEKGYRVTTFDYLGMGESKRHALKHYNNDILDWATTDCSVVLAHVLKHSRTLDVF